MGSRLALIGAGLVLVVAVVLLARPDDAGTPAPSASVPPSTAASTPALLSPEPSPTETATTVEVVVADGAVTTPIASEVPLGGEVVLRITSDVADEVHVHGYDLETEVSAGSTAELRFIADAAGVFEVEFHERGLLLLRLTVAP